jgi:hypothetical protein
LFSEPVKVSSGKFPNIKKSQLIPGFADKSLGLNDVLPIMPKVVSPFSKQEAVSMDSGEKAKPEVTMRGKGVSIETLGIIIGSTVFGSAATVFVMRAMQGGIETISTVGLLSFFLTLGLSISAIVLAVVAIVLSRTAERAIARKSEEMSALQSTMIAQTVAAIERMESSVLRIGEEIQGNMPVRDVLRADVTEAIERSLAEALIVVEKQEGEPEHSAADPSDETPAAEQRPEAVEEKTQAPVLPEPEPPAPEPATDEMREKADKKYGEFKDIVLLGVANYPGVISRKIGEGHYRTEGDELVDGVFVIQNEKVAVCTFCTSGTLVDRFMGETGDSFNGFLRSLFNELKHGHFTRVFLVFDGQLSNTSLYAKALNGLSGRIDAETFSRFELFEGTPDVVIPELTERVSQLMEAPVVEEEEVPELSFRRQMGA